MEQIDAQRVLGYVFFKDKEKTKLNYPLEKFSYDVAGRSFHNGRFIQRMREKASALHYVRIEQGTVTSLLEQDNKTVIGVKYKTKDGQELKAYAPLTIVCDGCFSNLRRFLCHPKVEVLSYSAGLVLENCQLPFENYGNIIMDYPSFVLFYRISSTEIRCLVDIAGQKFPPGGMANYLKTMVASEIPHELHDAFISAIDRGNIRVMPNRSMSADRYPTTPGALLMGDAFNMRHPLTGGGMTVALSDIVLLRDLLKPICDLNDATSLCKHLESFYILRKPMASTINTLADTPYKVFSASPNDVDAINEIRQTSFDYLSLGRFFSGGYITLLSGLNPSLLSLVLHFSAATCYGVGRFLLPFPSFERLWTGARLFLCAFVIILPIIKAGGERRQKKFLVSVPTLYKAPLNK
uniref:Squalene monooxygenase n=2 Tax=Cajanus cajan TaxID=3821 RepID=A0A151SAE5_CAJCA|nr:Squalene monooxygenase [Cajanus cajan]